ncbi:hypothetical protein [Desulfoluna spongiiphila]|uniref:Uncharacterized protein n=1 Tax=Desulfoluna spongiiphila TaxID=419481 RepID=A0A1G5GT85_9BACT|nr:hypothetical protein [Desulfoluna spongiiphila]SCY54763.1 hypothetical protein SAMN05216233_111122 [Desulfoluna spongiiphila]
MYDIEIGNTDLTVLKKYLADLKKRTALKTHRKTLGKVRRQLELIFSTKNPTRPAIPWGY